MDWLRDDLNAADVFDALLTTGGSSGLRCVLTLNHDFGTGRTLDSLEGTAVRVAGKVTRVVVSGEPLSLVRRSAFAYLPQEDQRAAFSGFEASPFPKDMLAGINVDPPYIQILPLAIFV